MKTIHTLILTFMLVVGLYSTNLAQDFTQVGLPEGAIARLGKGGINVMQFSPDGTHLAVGTDICVWLYHLPTGKETHLFDEQLEEINALAFSPDGNILASGGRTNDVIQLWDLSAGNIQPTHILDDVPTKLYELIFAIDNNTLFGLSEFGIVIEWKIDSGKRTSTKKFSGRGSVSTFAPSGITFVSGSPEKNEIRLWDAASDSLGDVFKETPNPSFRKKVKKGVETLAFSADNKTIASAHDDNIIRLWDIATKAQRVSLKGHSEIINIITFSPDSTLLASGSADNTIMLWDVNEDQRRTTLIGHKHSIKTLAFSPTEKGLLASGSSDGTVRFWDTKAGQERSIFATGFTESIKALAFTEDDKMLCSAASNGTVRIWDIITEKEILSPSVPHYDRVNALAFSQDATLFACNGVDTIVSSDGTHTSTNWRSYKETRLSILPTGDELRPFPQETSALAFSPDNKILATVSLREEAVQLWDINAGVKVFSFDTKLSLFEHLIFSPNGRFLALIGDEDQEQLWDITAEQKIEIPKLEQFSNLVFSPDSMTLAFKQTNDIGRPVISLWKITTSGLKKQKEIISNNTQGFGGLLSFSSDGQTLVESYSGRHKLFIKLWDVDTGNSIGTVNLSGHTKRAGPLVFSHDRKLLASGSEDGTILLWNWEKIVSCSLSLQK